MNKEVTGVITIENVQVGFKNFAGAEGPYNRKGDRNFAVFLDEDVARSLEAEGWNVKWPKERDDLNPDEDSREPYLPVAVSFKGIPPRITIIRGEQHDKLEEADLEMLDWSRILTADLILRPYNWTVTGKSGVKAYLKSGYFTLDVDELEMKYGF